MLVGENVLLVMTDAVSHRQVVRNGHLSIREILPGVGPITVTQPRVHDHREPQEREKFTDKFLPPHLQQAKKLEKLIPWLYF
ncbi:MAG: hypothetical protein WCI73_06850 [Phycisphaerae bacterium]